MADFRKIINKKNALIGMVHLHALPGTPKNNKTPEQIIAVAVDEATKLVEYGFDAVLVENMHDTPYLLREVGPEIIASMTVAVQAVVDAVDVPVGLQILAGANKAAIAVAHATGAHFIRAEGFAFASVADEGIMDVADAGPLLRERRRIDADDIAILADIQKKHSSHALTADLSIGDHARGADFMGADGVIVTGNHTGHAVDLAQLREVRGATELPLLVGSGVTPENVKDIFQYADAAIVGSSIKQGGNWANQLDATRCKELTSSL
ncbi:MAG TPA: BtpA/SgcQ family protein [Phycisphaerales bacterium]|nr:BtpA/SgcQ family protein [Phycisphaerales bacterium]HIO19958.1 BtpA/SgcQ family protein [Phycisphaerales bacterium]